MAKRKPQINFQVENNMKLLYDEAKAHGHWVTRLCAAGLLMMIEDADVRARALSRLRDWEAEYEKASAAEIRAFVEDAGAEMRAAARGSVRARKSLPAKRKAARG
ncbi:MAG: hypothetical protein AMXMBFR47_41780 [Planctomycetota bacterium]